MTTEAMIGSVSGVVSGLSSLVTVIIAGYGLFTWRKQYRTQVNFELARNLARAANAVEAAIGETRSAISLYADLETESSVRTVSEGKRIQVYNRAQLEKVHSKYHQAMEGLLDSAREAEMVWGGTAVGIAMLHFGLIDADIYIAIFSLKECVGKEDDEQFQKESEQQVQYVRRVYGTDDPFGIEIKEAVRRIKDAIKPHIKL